MEKNGVHTYKKRSQIKSIWFRFRKNRMAMIGLVIFLVMVAIAVCAPLLADYEEDAITQNLTERLIAPCKEHIFGTDAFGRDQFARIVYGARISLLVGVVIVLISGVLGSIIGATAGYYGGIVDNVIMRIMDVFLAIPQTLMAIAIVAALGGGIANLLLALSISSIPGFSRVVRSAILSVKDQSMWRRLVHVPPAIGESLPDIFFRMQLDRLSFRQRSIWPAQFSPLRVLALSALELHLPRLSGEVCSLRQKIKCGISHILLPYPELPLSFLLWALT